MNAINLTDGYKLDHRRQYPSNTTLVYSNWTPRSSRIQGINKVVFFGLQYFIKKYLIEEFDKSFFSKPKEEVVKQYQRRINAYLGNNSVGTKHIEDLHDLGYLPIEIKALSEGSMIDLKIPMLTVKNTHPDFFWLVNYFETIISATIWMPCTSATIALQYRKLLTKYANETGGDLNFVPFQGHDFSFRGMAGLEAAMMSGAGHLLSFSGTDTLPAIDFLEEYYNADCEKELIGMSVPATEHSVMCSGTKDDEIGTFNRLITEIYPTGIISIVSDTWVFWKVVTEYLPTLKDVIMSRDGKVVIRPDSGDPVDIICGTMLPKDPDYLARKNSSEEKGLIECLWDTFGGTINEQGFKVLDPHIGAIYGDSITLDRCKEICKRLKDKGFASTNIVFGIGSYSYQYQTRDTFGFAMKATYVEVDGVGREIFKDPKTDNGGKRSAKGLLKVERQGLTYKLVDQVGWNGEQEGSLHTIYKDGKLIKDMNYSEIKSKVARYFNEV